MKLWTKEHIFSHPWKSVTEAAWKKYPNEHNTNVTAIDVLDRKVSEDGRLHTTRIFGSNWNFPNLLAAILGLPEMCYAVEHSEVDLKQERMTLKMVNYTFWGILAVEETLVYQGNKENPNETQLTQDAKISIQGISFSSYFEDLLISNYDVNSVKGRTAIEQVVHKIKIENILDAVSEELQELKTDIDNATSKLDNEFHVTDKVHILAKDLDKATDIINTELSKFSSYLSGEFSQLVHRLSTELDQITVKVGHIDQDQKNRIRLTDAVKKAGIGVK